MFRSIVIVFYVVLEDVGIEVLHLADSIRLFYSRARLFAHSILKSTTIRPATLPFLRFWTASLNFDIPTTVGFRRSLPRTANCSVSFTSVMLETNVPLTPWLRKQSWAGTAVIYEPVSLIIQEIER